MAEYDYNILWLLTTVPSEEDQDAIDSMWDWMVRIGFSEEQVDALMCMRRQI